MNHRTACAGTPDGSPRVNKSFLTKKKPALNFGLDREFFDHLHNLPVKLTVAFAYEVYHDEDRRDFIIPEGQFVVPEIGVCSSDSSFARALSCRSALPGYRNLLVTADLSLNTCKLYKDEVRAEPGTIGRMWLRRASRVPDPLISPIERVELYLGGGWSRGVFGRSAGGVCPGTPLMLSHPRFLYKVQSSVQLDNVRLMDYGISAHVEVRLTR